MLADQLLNNKRIYIFQKKELIELIGYESRNKYSIELEGGQQIGFAAEQGKTFGSIFWRQILGHWRSFTINIYDLDQNLKYQVDHPFKFFFERVEVMTGDGSHIGVIQRRFSLVYKKFDILDDKGFLILNLQAPIWKPWTYPVLRKGMEVSIILKKWSGLLKESFTDADDFTIDYKSSKLSLKERELILAATLLIDIIFFERKGSSNRS